MKKFLPLILALSSLFTSILSARVWTSADGSKTFNADFVSSENGKVTLLKNGERTTFSISKLSKADQKWIIENNNQGPRIIGYLPDYRVSDQVLKSLDNYTDIVYFGSEFNADGSILISERTKKGLEKVAKIKNEKGTFRLHFCLGGWSKDKHFPAVTASPQKRKKLLSDLAKLHEKYQFAGVDYDWEYPTNDKQFRDFAKLIKETKAKFPEGFEVTAAINPMHNAPAVLWEHLDRIHMMCYDLGNEHCSISHSEKAINVWRKRGLPNTKMTIGAAFYGRLMKNRNEVKTYAQLVQVHGDKVATENKQGGYFYDNQVTLGEKLKLMKKEKIAGIIIWEIGQDSHDKNSLGAFLKSER